MHTDIKISQIRKFKVKDEIIEGMVHGKFNSHSFIVIVKEFATEEEKEFIVNNNDFIN